MLYATFKTQEVRMMVDEIFDFTEKFDTIIIVRPKYHEENYGNNKKGLERLKNSSFERKRQKAFIYRLSGVFSV